MKCPNCQIENLPGAAVCATCGAALPAEQPVMQQPYPQPYPQQPVVQQPYVQQPYVQQPVMQQPYVQQPVPVVPVPGAPVVPSVPMPGAPAAQPITMTPAASFSEFCKHFMSVKDRKNLKSCGILIIACAIISLVFAFIGENYGIILDVVLLLGLGLGAWLGRSRTCAILLTAYALFNMGYMLVSAGTFGGWLILLAGIYAIISTFAVHKSWKEYKKYYGIQ